MKNTKERHVKGNKLIINEKFECSHKCVLLEKNEKKKNSIIYFRIDRSQSYFIHFFDSSKFGGIQDLRAYYFVNSKIKIKIFHDTVKIVTNVKLFSY